MHEHDIEKHSLIVSSHSDKNQLFEYYYKVYKISLETVPMKLQLLTEWLIELIFLVKRIQNTKIYTVSTKVYAFTCSIV